MKALLFTLLALLQIGIPLAMIAKYEAVISYGTEYKFRCAPVDPVDSLRGRYVALNFEAANISRKDYEDVPCWASVSKSEDGFAKVEVSDARPTSEDFFKARKQWNRLQFPFDKYFMSESAAPKAEAAYRNSTRRPLGETRDWKPDTYLVVKIWHGCAVGSQLIIDGKPVEEIVAKPERR